MKFKILSLLLIFFLFSCEAEQIKPSEPVPAPEEEPAVDSTEVDKKNDETHEDTENKNTKRDDVIVGTGSGQLIIKDASDKNFIIKPGTYWNITIEKINNSTIDGKNSVLIEGGDMKISDVNGLEVNGVNFENYSQNAVIIKDDADDLTLKSLRFKNITNTVIVFKKDKKFDGTPSSYSENIQLDNIHAENTGTLFGSAGGIRQDGFYGLIKKFKLTSSTIKNSPILSNAVYLSLGEDYEFSNNIVDNVNLKNNNHNGIFFAQGNGKAFGNKVTNHQGNMIRAWLFSIDKPNAMVEIYDNVVYNSTRYGAFELQVTPTIEKLSAFKPANAKVYNNTVGRLNTGVPKYFEGRLLDLYQTYGTVEIYNNLSFDLYDDKLVNNMSDTRVTKITKDANNLYRKNSSDAVTDLKSFVSKISGVGARK